MRRSDATGMFGEGTHKVVHSTQTQERHIPHTLPRTAALLHLGLQLPHAPGRLPLRPITEDVAHFDGRPLVSLESCLVSEEQGVLAKLVENTQANAVMDQQSVRLADVHPSELYLRQISDGRRWVLHGGVNLELFR